MNLKSIITIIMLILTYHNGVAQYKISGQIKDLKTNENLTGASIYISDLKRGVSANTKGEFMLNDIKSGTYLLETSLIGYSTEIQQIEVLKDSSFMIYLNASVSELNEVIVTAVTRSTELKQSPIIIKAIDKNSINQNSATNLIDALKNVPGINQITTGASIAKPIIRGLGYNRVITLYNGVKQEGQQWGDEHGIEIDEFDIDRIEIVKGPGSLMYGSDGIAGVLHFLSPKTPNLGEIKSQLVTNYQSNNDLIGTSFSNAGNKKGFQWMTRISNKLASNYKNKFDGKVYNSGFKEMNGSLFLGINKNWGHSHLDLSTFNTTVNLVEGDRDENGKFIFEQPDGQAQTATEEDLKGYKIGFPHQEIQHLRAALNNYFILNKGTLNATFALQNNKRKEYGDVSNPEDIALFFDLTTFNYNVRYNLAKFKGWETSFGLGGMQQRNANKGIEFLIPAYQLFDAGVFAFAQKTFNKNFTLAGGLRFDNRLMDSEKLILDDNDLPVNQENATTTLKFNNFQENYSGLSGSVGVSYQINKTSTFKGNISRGFRAPTIAELASNGRHEGTFRYEIGTQNLKPEISHQLDLAYFFNSDHINFEVTPFVNAISNYIYTEKMKDENGNDIITDESDPAPQFKFVQGNAILFGGEVYLDIHPHPLDWLHIENSFSFVQAIQTNQPDSTRFLPFIPAPKYRIELKAQFKKMGNYFTNSYFKIGLDYFFKQDKIFSTYETETPSYTLLSAGVGSNLRAFNRKDFANIFISAENLADVGYQNHLSRLKYAPENILTGRSGVFNIGRNISVKLIFNF